MHAYTGKNSPYHKPEDTYEKLDYSGMANVCTFLGDFITTLSAAPELMPSHIFALAKKPVPVRFKTGVVAAMGSAHHDYPGEFYNAKGVLAFNAGVFAQIYLGKRFAIQPELLYQTDGSKTAEGVFRRHSVSVPVNLQYTLFYDNYDMLRIYPFAGGYYNRSFAGKNGDESLDFDNKYSANEWGVDFGLGLDIMKLQIGFTWQYGLTNLLKDDEEVVHPFRWFIAVGYKFR
jgi:hypothetical protein